MPNSFNQQISWTVVGPGDSAVTSQKTDPTCVLVGEMPQPNKGKHRRDVQWEIS